MLLKYDHLILKSDEKTYSNQNLGLKKRQFFFGENDRENGHVLFSEKPRDFKEMVENINILCICLIPN